MSGSIKNNLTIPKAINHSEGLYKRLLRTTVIGNSKEKRVATKNHSSALLRVQLVHLGIVGTRALLTTRNVKAQEDLIQGPRNAMEEKNQEKQGVVNQSLSKITSKLMSLFRKSNFVSQGTHKMQSSTTVSNPTLANQNIYPIAGNIAASTQTNTAISLQARETPEESAINIINLSAPELKRQLPIALNQSIETLNKIGQKMNQRAINASLL